jgi:2-keto-3-deoxy-L-rhamnonate aldolase RhmA
MMKNFAKEKILKNELCLGVGLRQSRTVDIGKIMSTCGYDWLFIDMEHNIMPQEFLTVEQWALFFHMLTMLKQLRG